MFWRAILLLVLVASASIGLTFLFGAKVLLALGLILTQLKVIGSKLLAIEIPAVLIWFKAQAALFFRLELLKKWVMTSILPLLMGSVLRRRIETFLTRYKTAIRLRYDAMIAWYGRLEWYEKLIAALIVVFASLGLSVSSLGLWLVLFSVKLPFWLIAGLAAFGKMFWGSLTKGLFKAIAFLQLGWAWKLIRKRLPESYLDRKRRWDFRVARAVVRRRRLTLRQLHDQKDGLSMRVALIKGYFRQPRPDLTLDQDVDED